MNRRSEFEPLLEDMFTVYIESNLASPLSGEVTLNISPKVSVRNLIHDFLLLLQNDDSVPGLAVFDKHHNRLNWNSSLESQNIKDGSKLYIGFDRKSLLKPIHFVFIGFITLSIAILLLIASVAVFTATGGEIPTDYGVVIDAGSTHTEVFLYHWPGNKNNGTGEVYQTESCSYGVGIAKKEFDPARVISCLNNVSTFIPSGGLAKGLYLGATGGMRLLNFTNPKDANLLLMTLKYALSTSSIPVKTVEIIPGKDEATYSWISTNFLENILNQDELNYTYGSLDLGGASTQFAYASQDHVEDNLTDFTLLNLYGHEHQIISKSYLCFGYYEAMSRAQAITMVEIKNATIADPCLPIGFEETFNVQDFSEDSCAVNHNFRSWLKSDTSIDKIVVSGSSNYSECTKNVKKLLNKTTCHSYGYNECLPQNNLADLNMKFMAFSGFYYVVKFFNASDSLENLMEGAEKFCTLTWQEIQQQVPKSLWEYVSKYCFAAVYITELLTSNYGFNSTVWSNILFIEQIKETDVGWTLGYMINATNSLNEENSTTPAISVTILVLLIIISLSMMIVSVLMLRSYFRCQSRFNYRDMDF